MKNDVAIHTVELCAGVGMLGEGLRAACEFHGLDSRAVCYVEREASAAGQLVALMEAGALDTAPVWSDLRTFDGAAWRGRVDCVVAGFPCQDLSVAGLRAGLDGKRSGLFFDVVRVAQDCGAWLLVLENVAGIASAPAAVVDETEGELIERAASRVVGELADLGWSAEWMHIRAADVGANHQRERWFCVAWRMADCSGDAIRRNSGAASRPEEQDGRRSAQECHRTECLHSAMGDTDEQRQRQSNDAPIPESGQRSRTRSGGSGLLVGDASGDGRDQGWPESGGEQRRFDVAEHGSAMGHSEGQRDGSRGLSIGNRSTLARASDADGNMGDPNGAGPQGWGDEPGERRGEWVAGPSGVDELFAPGPLDYRWPGIVADRPDLAPATEPGVRMLADGLAYLVDESRNHQLRQAGNGVVALQAAVAIVVLGRRAGIF